MSRATCPKCGNTDVSWIRDEADCAQYICLECKQSFCYPPKTLFEHITESPEVLAEKLVYCVPVPLFEPGAGFERWYTVFSPFNVQKYFRTKEEAIATAVAKLKEVEK